MADPDDKITWRALYHDLVDAVIYALGAVKKVRVTRHISKEDGMKIAGALMILSGLLNEFYSIAPTEFTANEYDKPLTPEGELLQQRMTAQINLIEGIIERADAL